MNNEEKLDELERKVDEAIQADNTHDLNDEEIDKMIKEAEEVYNQEQLDQVPVSENNTLEEGKQKKLTWRKFNSNGFAEGFIFTLLVGFTAGAVFTIVYILLQAGKYSFIM